MLFVALESDSEPLVPFLAEVEYFCTGFLCSRGGPDPGFLDSPPDFELLVLFDLSPLDGPDGSVFTFNNSVFTEFTRLEDMSF